MAMINKINTWSNPISKLYAWSTEVQKAYLWDTLIYGDDGTTPLLKFTAEEANSTIQLNRWFWGYINDFEISTDGINWRDYIFTGTDTTYYWEIITLANVWNYVHIRNKSETYKNLNHSNQRSHEFVMSWLISASWDIWYLSCKNSTLLATGSWQYHTLFAHCASLTTPPMLPATEIWYKVYYDLFRWCTNLIWLPKLPALSIQRESYEDMFYGCSKIKLSTTRTSEYTQPYRIPTNWTWTAGVYAFDMMFKSTWWTFTWTPTINTTYYLHKDNTIVW